MDFRDFRQLLVGEADNSTHYDDEQRVELLLEIRETIRELRVMEDDLVHALAFGKSNGDLIDDRVEVRWSKTGAKWDRDAARRAILAMEREKSISDGEFAVDLETGEKVPTWEAAVAAISKHWLLGDPRTTAMKEDLGLDPDEFREGGKPKPSVRSLA